MLSNSDGGLPGAAGERHGYCQEEDKDGSLTSTASEFSCHRSDFSVTWSSDDDVDAVTPTQDPVNGLLNLLKKPQPQIQVGGMKPTSVVPQVGEKIDMALASRGLMADITDEWQKLNQKTWEARPPAQQGRTPLRAVLGRSPVVQDPPSQQGRTPLRSPAGQDLPSQQGKTPLRLPGKTAKTALRSNAKIFVPKASADRSEEDSITAVRRVVQETFGDALQTVQSYKTETSTLVNLTLSRPSVCGQGPQDDFSQAAWIFQTALSDAGPNFQKVQSVGDDYVCFEYYHGLPETLCVDFVCNGYCAWHSSCKWVHPSSEKFEIFLFVLPTPQAPAPAPAPAPGTSASASMKCMLVATAPLPPPPPQLKAGKTDKEDAISSASAKGKHLETELEALLAKLQDREEEKKTSSRNTEKVRPDAETCKRTDSDRKKWADLSEDEEDSIWIRSKPKGYSGPMQ